jgi:hypothetical protein
MRRQAFSTRDLNQLQRQLFAWRRQQSGRPRLPEALWGAATDLARSQGLSLVARALRLDYYKLRQRLAGTSSLRPALPTFVEVKGEAMSEVGPSEACVELADGTGVRMTLRVRSDLATLVALVQSFWRRGR